MSCFALQHDALVAWRETHHYTTIPCLYFTNHSSFTIIIGRQHYRLYAIHHIPTLKVLDFERITQSEREKAERLASSAAGAALEKDVQQEKTFVPGEGRSAEESFATSFTPAQKEQIRQMVANAKTPAEIEEIELSVQRGIFPGIPEKAPTVTPPLAATNGEQGDDRKRKAQDDDEEKVAAKRSRVDEEKAS